MLLKLFEKTFGLLIGRVPEEKKAAAWEKFTELVSILAEKGAEGAVEGMKH